VAPWPWVRGVVRQLNGAARSEALCPPHPAPGLSGGRGVAALRLARHDGHHALEKVGARVEERGRLSCLQAGLGRASRHASRLGPLLDTLWAAQLNRVFGASARPALEV
jgi:hypothetical protein